MTALNELEIILLNKLFHKYPGLQKHLPFLKVSERVLTKGGMIVHLMYENFNSPLDDINALFSDEENIETSNLKNGLVYVIDVTDGEIKFIELMTYNEPWNGSLDNYKIVKKP